VCSTAKNKCEILINMCPIMVYSTPWTIGLRGANLFLCVTSSKSNGFNAVINARFRNERHIWGHEFHPPHLTIVATLPCEIRITENVMSPREINVVYAMRLYVSIYNSENGIEIHWCLTKLQTQNKLVPFVAYKVACGFVARCDFVASAYVDKP